MSALPKTRVDRRNDAGGTERQSAPELQTESRRKYPASTLLESSSGRGWSTLHAELRTHPAGTISSAVQPSVEIVIALSGSDDGLVIRNGAGRHQEARPTSGTIWLAPTGIGPEEIIITAPLPRLLHLYLPMRQFDVLADQYNLSPSLVRSVQYLGGLQDDFIRQLGKSVLTELQHETATSRIFAETISSTLAARLIHGYADVRFFDTAAPYRLDNARLRRVLDYIDQHLEKDFTIAALADLAHLSVFHFARMFTAAIGIPPHRYVSQRRLEAAMGMLAAGKLPLAEIAYRSGFSSQASFTRAFRRATGIPPGEYRRHRR